MATSKAIHHVEFYDYGADEYGYIYGQITCIIGLRGIPLNATENWNDVTCRFCLKEKPQLWLVPEEAK